MTGRISETSEDLYQATRRHIPQTALFLLLCPQDDALWQTEENVDEESESEEDYSSEEESNDA